MYRPTLYSKHDQTMNGFANLFNRFPDYRHIEKRPNPVETYDNDGVFLDHLHKRKIGYDWEYRDRYFANCIFQYPTLGQFERKIRKPSIQISLQCDSTETGIAAAWHSDWKLEAQQHLDLRTDYEEKEKGTTRYTNKFKIYSYEKIGDFKRMIAAALEFQIYSSEIF